MNLLRLSSDVWCEVQLKTKPVDVEEPDRKIYCFVIIISYCSSHAASPTTFRTQLPIISSFLYLAHELIQKSKFPISKAKL